MAKLVNKKWSGADYPMCLGQDDPDSGGIIVGSVKPKIYGAVTED